MPQEQLIKTRTKSQLPYFVGLRTSYDSLVLLPQTDPDIKCSPIYGIKQPYTTVHRYRLKYCDLIL